TGSSAIPTPGAKRRETKSAPGRAAGAVTMTPRVPYPASATVSGRSPVTSSSRPRTTMRSSLAWPVHSALSTPSAASSPGGAGAGRAGRAGKSSTSRPSLRRAVSGPLTESNRTGPVGSACPVSYRMWALARVACPHRPTSATGVNQRSPYPAARGSRKAVSDRFISLATDCIHPASAGPPSRHTAAGLPANTRSAKASTWNKRMPAAYGDRSAGGVRARPEGGAVAGHDHRRHREDALPASLQRRLVGAERVDRRAVRRPPRVRAGVDAIGGGGQGGDVLVGVAGGGHQPDRAGEVESAVFPVHPPSPGVGARVVGGVARGHQRRVGGGEGVAGAEPRVRHAAGRRPRRGQRGEQRGAVGHHPGVDDDHALAVDDEH